MSLRDTRFSTIIRFPIIFGTCLFATGAAFYYNRRYFLQGIKEEAENLYNQDPEATRLLEECKQQYNREKKSKTNPA